MSRRVFRFPIARPPDEIIGEPRHPYLLRWCLLPENRWFNVFLHCILRDDPDAALHDHPWGFVSIMLKGAYREILADFSNSPTPYVRVTDVPWRIKERHAVSMAWRRAVTAHRLEIINGPVWTLLITGPCVRTWGFHRSNG